MCMQHFPIQHPSIQHLLHACVERPNLATPKTTLYVSKDYVYAVLQAQMALFTVKTKPYLSFTVDTNYRVLLQKAAWQSGVYKGVSKLSIDISEEIKAALYDSQNISDTTEVNGIVQCKVGL